MIVQRVRLKITRQPSYIGEFAMPAFHIGSLLLILAPVLPIQLPANLPVKAAGAGPGTRILAMHREIGFKVPGLLASAWF